MQITIDKDIASGIKLLQSAVEQNNWPWDYPIRIFVYRRWIALGNRILEIHTNLNQAGGNVRAKVDLETKKVLHLTMSEL